MKKILIVDDDAFSLYPLEAIISSFGYQTHTAEYGQKAILIYKEWHPDLVLLDRDMKGMDGLETLKRIISWDPNARVVMVSGYVLDKEEEEDNNIAQLTAGYLTKPFHLETIKKFLSDFFCSADTSEKASRP